MPRKHFVQDLERVRGTGSFPYLHNIRKGDDDESICFSFSHPDDPLMTLDFQVAVSDLTEYPHSHQYLIFSTSTTVPPAVVDVLEVAQAAAAGSSVSDLLSTVNDALEKTLVSGSHQDTPEGGSGIDNSITDAVASPDSEIESDSETPWDDEFFDEDQQFFGSSQKPVAISSSLKPDLRETKAAGFKVGYLGDPNGSVILSISCRISRLGISEEAMQAWDVQGNQYLVLLLRFPQGYVNANHLLELKNSSSLVQMHVGLCASYKPNITDAHQAFTGTSTTHLPVSGLITQSDSVEKLLSLFLEIPLNTLLNERFITILRLRHRYSLSWAGAESLFNDCQGLILNDQQAPQENHALYRCKDEWGDTVPHLVQDDHFSSTNDPECLSFPLLAMQFTLRHFVKCTQFCLVCHCKTDTNFEALKPYVCSKPLCLYQYMALGIGPSLEWEITRQPLVIDLLISFAYASACAGSMEELPVGLRMMVPPLYDPTGIQSGLLHRLGNEHGLESELTVNEPHQEILIKQGDWILIDKPNGDEKLGQYGFCQVLDTNKWPIVKIWEPVTQHTRVMESATDPLFVNFTLHNVNFDDIEGRAHKQQIIVGLLQSLPDVESMKKWLEKAAPGSKNLSLWKNIPPAALDLLRWIVASNRSCIVQDGTAFGQSGGTPRHNLVTGMDGYLQFRFAQGSPDKEEKFVSAVSKNSFNSKYPTIFAWHGSALSNWHGIIREGLHFKKVTNGRACGDGVYMARDFDMSASYSGRHAFVSNPGMRTGSKWPNSLLNMTCAIALNEVVNKPSEFVHHANGVYVVDRIEWIQTRYLFVDCQKSPVNQNLVGPSTPPVEHATGDEILYYAQHPDYTATGVDGKPINIPMTIFSRRRRNLGLDNDEQEEPKTAAKGKSKKEERRSQSRKRKLRSTEVLLNDATDDGDDTASVATLAEDLAILFSDADQEAESETEKSIKKLKLPSVSKGKTKAMTENTTVTLFEPGTLTESSITILPPPSYATSSATKALQKRLLQALKAQDQTPPDELGWYINPQLINNPYQWIIELHSFDLSHPLGQDLQKAGLQSIILEMRFPPDFPMSPPFVRVIRPRLLEFNQGGGGHVTMGGALCMELLTGSGWLPTFSIENVLLSIRLALCSIDPKPARLASTSSWSWRLDKGDYSVMEAVDAYTRACRAHGWQVPKDFEKMAW
ncbi:ubiquitin conjugating enzyme, putative [Talaromyces stipitatus ATCC 10500]|uniref:Ubiquitin conjugating enzyme, putative n=1 Tax=Talaromyces stipitatus (strain ATCC 10500 / CBS 375.48 / QM 6759 / NRRL 1006) TaxID=441959 RepID=B8M6M3_TALSN|nr:ubiquitin conjugating enzyme, putative [Talaromyces stipitatus ATCC 10500]EED19485.1 ubiquitin conjugating enzyme, putative [Talaromyces stipitatus ATCC 10500]